MSKVVVRNLSKSFGHVHAVRGITFRVSQGEMAALLGPSGCGKTTTLRIIAGLAEADQGRVCIGADDVTHVPAYQRAVGMVFQNYALFPHMTVRDNIAFGLMMRRWTRREVDARVAEMLELVGLPGVARRKPRELSGGQQQRIALARALAPKPRVMLFDEPLSNLDLKLRLRMRLELKQIQRELGFTGIFVTHDQGEALALADKVLVMREGLIEQEGTPEEIYRNPRSTFVADFIGEANFFAATVHRLEGDELLAESQGHLMRCMLGDDHTRALRPGAPIQLAVRPTEMELDQERPDTDNALQATVIGRTYAGSVVRYVLNVANAKMTVDQRQARSTPLHDPGQLVWVGWNKEASIVIAESDLPAPAAAESADR